MTTTATKIQTKWDAKKTQEAAAKIVASLYVAAFQALAKTGNKEAYEEFENTVRQFKVNHYKQLGVKTPIDLVKAMAECEYNVFGSEIEISGDEKKAEIKHNTCGLWNAMQELGKFTPEQEEKLGQHFQQSLAKTAKEFGFNIDAKFEKDSCLVTFSK